MIGCHTPPRVVTIRISPDGRGPNISITSAGQRFCFVTNVTQSLTLGEAISGVLGNDDRSRHVSISRPSRQKHGLFGHSSASSPTSDDYRSHLLGIRSGWTRYEYSRRTNVSTSRTAPTTAARRGALDFARPSPGLRPRRRSLFAGLETIGTCIPPAQVYPSASRKHPSDHVPG